jgi:hypothetical protein
MWLRRQYSLAILSAEAHQANKPNTTQHNSKHSTHTTQNSAAFPIPRLGAPRGRTPKVPEFSLMLLPAPRNNPTRTILAHRVPGEVARMMTAWEAVTKGKQMRRHNITSVQSTEHASARLPRMRTHAYCIFSSRPGVTHDTPPTVPRSTCLTAATHNEDNTQVKSADACECTQACRGEHTSKKWIIR